MKSATPADPPSEGGPAVSRKERWPFKASADGLWQQCYLLAKQHGLEVEGEHLFHPRRKFKADVAFPELKIICEYQGLYKMGREGGHQTFKGLRRDYERANEAQLHGWIYLQFEAEATRSGEAMNVIERAIEIVLKGKAA